MIEILLVNIFISSIMSSRWGDHYGAITTAWFISPAVAGYRIFSLSRLHLDIILKIIRNILCRNIHLEYMGGHPF